MQTSPDRVPVLIAGGGPVGLMLAALLGRYGIRSLVIEADEGYCTGSRAICISRLDFIAQAERLTMDAHERPGR